VWHRLCVAGGLPVAVADRTGVAVSASAPRASCCYQSAGAGRCGPGGHGPARYRPGGHKARMEAAPGATRPAWKQPRGPQGPHGSSPGGHRPEPKQPWGPQGPNRFAWMLDGCHEAASTLGLGRAGLGRLGRLGRAGLGRAGVPDGEVARGAGPGFAGPGLGRGMWCAGRAGSAPVRSRSGFVGFYRVGRAPHSPTRMAIAVNIGQKASALRAPSARDSGNTVPLALDARCWL
jgi:hypothetical protein